MSEPNVSLFHEETTCVVIGSQVNPKRKRTSFAGGEKLIRDALLIGIVQKIDAKKAKNDGRVPYGFIGKLVKGCEKYCPTFKINPSTIRQSIEKEAKRREIDNATHSSTASPMVDETAAELLIAMKRSITPLSELSNNVAYSNHNISLLKSSPTTPRKTSSRQLECTQTHFTES